MSFKNPYPIPLPPGYDRTKQGVRVPGTERAGQTPVYVSGAYPVLTPGPDVPKTAYDCFNLGLRTNPAADCLGRRPWSEIKGDWADEYVWETYASVDQHRTRIGSALVKLQQAGAVGSEHMTGWSVGVWTGNRPEWQYVSQACSAYNLALISLYDTLGPNVVEYCITHSSTRVIFASASHIPLLISLAGSQCPTVKVVVSVDTWADIESKGRPGLKSESALKTWGAEKGIQIYDIAEIEAMGASSPAPHIVPSPDDMASICYTSGTTGNPKGAILLHKNLAAAATINLHGGQQMGTDAILFSYLPLSHIYERFCEDTAFAAGAAIGFHCGDNLRLLEDLALLKPTFFVSVPRVLNRVYQSVRASTTDAPGFKGVLTRKAFADKLYNLKHHGTYTHALWDRIVFKKIRAALGGRVSFIGSGSAPISPEVLAFLKVAFCCEVTEGYGMTENCGTATKCVEGDHDPKGAVGPPSAGIEIKLVDVPDMEYFSTDKPAPRGELCTRGPTVISGYYHDEAKTKETIDAEGWLHTGDIASVDEYGRFKIIDRIKNLVKLSQGEYIALEKVENAYSLCPLIAQIYIHGDGLQDHVVAIMVPDVEKLAPLASKALGKTVTAAELGPIANDPRVIDAVAAELKLYADSARLLGFERINKEIYISLDPFTMDNDLLTPTFKTKRNIAAKVYRPQIDKLYSSKPKKVAAKL